MSSYKETDLFVLAKAQKGFPPSLVLEELGVLNLYKKERPDFIKIANAQCKMYWARRLKDCASDSKNELKAIDLFLTYFVFHEETTSEEVKKLVEVKFR